MVQLYGMTVVTCDKQPFHCANALVYAGTRLAAIKQWNEKNDPVKLAKIAKRIHKLDAKDNGYV